MEQDETSMLSEARDIYFDYDKKSEDDKANLMTIQYSYQAIPHLLLLNSNEESTILMLQMLIDTSSDKFVRTNYLIRQAILHCFREVLE